MTTFEAIGEAKERLIASVVSTLYDRHPEWETRWGATGRESCARDVGFTLAFTEASVRSDDPSILVEYARWLAGLLLARGVPVESARESFALLEAALEKTVSPAEAARASAALADAREALDAPSLTAGGGAPLVARAAEFLAALLRADRPALLAILEDAAAQGMDAAAIADSIIQPAMTEVGARWARNEITVAEEHRATALAQAVLARFGPQASRAEEGIAVIGCVEGNLHSLGARVFADALEAQGWDVHFLGADVPTRDLIAYVRSREVDLVGLSVALPIDLVGARRVIGALRRELGDACPRIVVGGKSVREYGRGAASVGADEVFSDASAGVAGIR